jgi:deoxyadenosine/deoxycytidine kinase
MGKLVTIAGNSGVGKTTLVHALREVGDYFVALEEHDTRPFHDLCVQHPKQYALANQLDFLLLRAEQEQVIRQQTQPGLVDGGLEVDYWGFCHLFHHKGLLTPADFSLCQRFYRHLRALSPQPDLIIYLEAPPTAVVQRFKQRHRKLELTETDDLIQLDFFLHQWLETTAVAPVLTLDATSDSYLRPLELQTLHQTIEHHLTSNEKDSAQP